jgi:hypothetical protein
MNIHVFFNDGQKILFDRYFSPSLKDDWRIIAHPVRTMTKDQNFGTQGFKEIIHEKIDILIHEIFPQEEVGYGFILSDVDIQFFKPCSPIVRNCLERHDIVFQREYPHINEVNTGFIAMRVTPEVVNFWKRISRVMKDNLKNQDFINEQGLANKFLKTESMLNWGIFPNEIWAWTNNRIFPWYLHLPGIFLHHANDTYATVNKTSLDFKIEQLDLVKIIVHSKTSYFIFMINNFMKRSLRHIRLLRHKKPFP